MRVETSLDPEESEAPHSTPVARARPREEPEDLNLNTPLRMAPKKAAFASIGEGINESIDDSAWANVETAGLGTHMGRTLRRAGWNGKTPVASVVMTIENGKVMGSRWVLRGNLGKVKVPLRRVQEEDQHLKATIDLRELSQVTFPSLTNPAEGRANHSEWVDGADWIPSTVTNEG